MYLLRSLYTETVEADVAEIGTRGAARIVAESGGNVGRACLARLPRTGVLACPGIVRAGGRQLPGLSLARRLFVLNRPMLVHPILPD